MKYQDSYEHVFADYCKALVAMLIALFWSAAQTLLTSPVYSVAFLAAYYVGLASAAACTYNLRKIARFWCRSEAIFVASDQFGTEDKK